ncbi:MAG TPA: cupin domain-containing protein [Pyrinomonadaceae bacterium]|nr:cupin domain-containing protein [Pyrinomonadaceae bacterium]
MKFGFVFVFLLIGLPVAVFGQGVTKPKQILNEIIKGMPMGKDQEVRVLTAEFKPGDKTVFHKHRFPVTVYILEGAFTLNLEGRKEPLVVKAGEAYIEPPNVKMTGYNRSATEPLRLVIFYVSDKDTPFLDMIDMADMPDMPKDK